MPYIKRQQRMFRKSGGNMSNTATISYKTPWARTLVAAGIILALIILADILMYQISGKIFGLLWVAVFFGITITLSRSGIAVAPDAVIIKRGLGKKEYPLKGVTFFYTEKSGLPALLQSLSLRTIILRIQQDGKSDVVMAVNIPREDFEKVMAAMREHGGAVNAA